MSEPTTDPWVYGRYRVVIQRRVTEEEQISVECYEMTRDAAQETFDRFMAAMNAHRVNYNDNVIMVAKGKLAQIDRLIDQKAEELHDLEQQIEARRAEREGNGCDPLAAS